MHTNTRIHMHAHIHMHTHIHTHTHMHMNTQIHTHTHTLSLSLCLTHTSFLFFHQMQLLSGSVQVTGRIAYVGQEPWIFNGTARENIIFGCPYDKEK